MQFLERKKRSITINITSLIDVMFLLLIFFMVSSTFLERPGMKLDLPQAGSSEAVVVKDLILQMLADGKLVLNDNDIKLDRIIDEFKTMMSRNKSETLILQADKKVSHGDVVSVLDMAKKAGIKKLVIATRPQEK